MYAICVCLCSSARGRSGKSRAGSACSLRPITPCFCRRLLWCGVRSAMTPSKNHRRDTATRNESNEDSSKIVDRPVQRGMGGHGPARHQHEEDCCCNAPARAAAMIGCFGDLRADRSFMAADTTPTTRTSAIRRRPHSHGPRLSRNMANIVTGLKSSMMPLLCQTAQHCPVSALQALFLDQP